MDAAKSGFIKRYSDRSGSQRVNVNFLNSKAKPQMLKYWFKQNYKLAKARVDWIRGAPKLRRRFFRAHGYPLNLDNPQTFSEKIQWRKIYDNNPIFPVLSNKYLVREYIASRLGDERAQELLVPLLQYAKDPAEIDFAALPSQFVLKATHGSGMNLIVEDVTKLDHPATRALMRKWLMTHYGIKNHEWVYTKTPRGILVEELVAPSDQIMDLKIFYFNGKMGGFLIHEQADGKKLTHFDAEGVCLDARKFGTPNNPEVVQPVWLDEMVEIGETLSRDLDFVRVDFVCTPNRFYLGEMSLIPRSGLGPTEPQSYDQELGSLWKIDLRSEKYGTSCR